MLGRAVTYLGSTGEFGSGTSALHLVTRPNSLESGCPGRPFVMVKWQRN
jgi:hypothetical protein